MFLNINKTMSTALTQSYLHTVDNIKETEDKLRKDYRSFFRDDEQFGYFARLPLTANQRQILILDLLKEGNAERGPTEKKARTEGPIQEEAKEV